MYILYNCKSGIYLHVMYNVFSKDTYYIDNNTTHHAKTVSMSESYIFCKVKCFQSCTA